MAEGKAYSESELQDSRDHLREFLSEGDLTHFERVIVIDALSLHDTIRDRDKQIAELNDRIYRLEAEIDVRKTTDGLSVIEQQNQLMREVITEVYNNASDAIAIYICKETLAKLDGDKE